jgi:hypothetical protein
LAQQTVPLAQSLWLVQGQSSLHWWLEGLQHWPARQSPLVWQQAKQLPSLPQHWPLGQSALVQHWALVHTSPQQISPPAHWAEVVQPHVAWLQTCVAVSQHWPATQSAVVQQPEMQAASQQTSPPAHSASEEHGQSLVHCWVLGSQHWPATQSPSFWQQSKHDPSPQH